MRRDTDEEAVILQQVEVIPTSPNSGQSWRACPHDLSPYDSFSHVSSEPTQSAMLDWESFKRDTFFLDITTEGKVVVVFQWTSPDLAWSCCSLLVREGANRRDSNIPCTVLQCRLILNIKAFHNTITKDCSRKGVLTCDCETCLAENFHRYTVQRMFSALFGY